MAHIMDQFNGKFGDSAVFLGGMHGAEEDVPTRFAFNHIPDLSTQELAELDEELLSQRRHFAIRVDRLFGWGLTNPPKLPTEGLLPAFSQERW